MTRGGYIETVDRWKPSYEYADDGLNDIQEKAAESARISGNRSLNSVVKRMNRVDASQQIQGEPSSQAFLVDELQLEPQADNAFGQTAVPSENRDLNNPNAVTPQLVPLENLLEFEPRAVRGLLKHSSITKGIGTPDMELLGFMERKLEKPGKRITSQRDVLEFQKFKSFLTEELRKKGVTEVPYIRGKGVRKTTVKRKTPTRRGCSKYS